jgi:hypothetical protein
MGWMRFNEQNRNRKERKKGDTILGVPLLHAPTVLPETIEVSLELVLMCSHRH